MLKYTLISILIIISLISIINCEKDKTRTPHFFDKECEFKCPPGKKQQINHNHVPSYNGCGAGAFKIETNDDITNCCNEHDICYDTCFNTKKDCDEKFSKCLNGVCESYGPGEDQQRCYTAAIALDFGVSMGCSFYKKSQSNACDCIEKNEL
eukprot:TRINITY_DN9653_c0_g1_i1.p1 TRINITY_DN9653_c0_g1~~TRINITY_DN9653_c0_g1_i1.p1  ORF type:complete len:152 (+),score=35.65 TRINITY_DN9653_c0_g1_i1:88-543(+)